MDVNAILIAAIIIGLVGVLIGVLLCIASEKFKVEVDERETLVREALPGNNCGGCGYPGCDGLAKAIVEGKAPVSGCPVGGAPVAEKIGEILGVAVGETIKKVAHVNCIGDCDHAPKKFAYHGIKDCNKLAAVPGGSDKGCEYGCMGYGSCVSACEFDAIHIVNGIALVDKEACVACGACVAACPKNLIDIIPYTAAHIVNCSSLDKGKDVKSKCSLGCIGCTLCTKQCEDDAIHMYGNVAKIDYEKCTNCGKCAAKCPTKVIATDKLELSDAS